MGALEDILVEAIEGVAKKYANKDAEELRLRLELIRKRDEQIVKNLTQTLIRTHKAQPNWSHAQANNLISGLIEQLKPEG